MRSAAAAPGNAADLEVKLVDVFEEAAHRLLAPAVVQEHEPDVTGRRKGRHLKVVELVNKPQVHGRRRPLLLFYGVQGRVENEMVQVLRARLQSSESINGLCLQTLTLVKVLAPLPCRTEVLSPVAHLIAPP